MKKFAEKVYDSIEAVCKWFFVLFFAVLTMGALFVTETANDMQEQKMVFSFDRMYISIPVMFLIVFCGWLIVKCVSKNYAKRLKWFRRIVSLWYVLAGVILFLFARTCPGADAMSVYSMAEMVSEGKLGIIAGPEYSYMSYYPQQIGLTTFLALILKIFRLFPMPIAGYHLLKFPYLFMICIATLLQEKIVRKMWNNDAVCCIFLYLSAVNFPYVFYSTFIYSEIPAFFFFTIGAWLLCECLAKHEEEQGGRCKKEGYKVFFTAVLSVFSFAIAVLIRKNTLVLMIAVLIVTFFHWFIRHNWEWLAYSILCGIVCVSILPLVIGMYENRAGNTLSEGVTASSYIAMGMQDTSGRGPGWYNGFNNSTYEKAGFDIDEADRISRQAISERKDYFANNPKEALKFYSRKISTQWFDGTYASLQATQATVSERSAFFNELFYGKYKAIYDEYCNAYQGVVYCGAFVCMMCLLKERKKNNLWKFMFAIGVFGGFLFHVLWEANSRYIVTYSFLLIPYGALGINTILNIKRTETKKKVLQGDIDGEEK